MASRTDSTTREFPFPFKPHPAQWELMSEVYGVCERGGVEIPESPTGTGKFISVICAALPSSYLQDGFLTKQGGVVFRSFFSCGVDGALGSCGICLFRGCLLFFIIGKHENSENLHSGSGVPPVVATDMGR